MQETSTLPRPAVRFRIEKLDELIEPVAGASDEAKARFLKVSYVTLWRLRNEPDHKPSAKFIAAVLAAIPRARFEDLFEVVSTA